MRVCLALLLLVFAVLAPRAARAEEALAEEPSRLAVIPYLTLNLDPEEELSLREILSAEVKANTSAKILPSVDLKKLGTLPDGCTESPACVLSTGQALRADYLLFIVLLKQDAEIELVLTLAEVGGGGAIRSKSIKLSVQNTDAWGDLSDDAMRELLSGVKRLARPAPPAGTPATRYVIVPGEPLPVQGPPAKRWPWLVAGGSVLAVGGIALFFFLPPASTFGAFGPGARP